MRIGLLNNLRAGRSDARVNRVLRYLRGRSDVLHVETEGANAVPEALADLARKEVELLVVHGGDGTLQHALTELLASDVFPRLPLIAPLRGGRTNMTAMDLGAHRDPVKGLSAILRDAEAGTIAHRRVERPVLRVEFDSGTQVRYGMFFGVGMIHRAIELTHRLFPTGRSQGSFGAGLVTASLIAKAMWRPKDGVLEPDKAQILLDGEMVPRGEFYLVIASTLRRLFLRMDPFWGREPNPVRFTCVSTDALEHENIVRSAVRVLRGRPPVSEEPVGSLVSRNVERSELRLNAGFTIDGEIFAPVADQVVRVTAEPRVAFVRG